jgi:hypothetical protein
MMVDTQAGKESETRFRLLQKKEAIALVACHPLTGRTHQIRVHLAQSGHPIVSDELYGHVHPRMQLGLRAVMLAYQDPFTRRRVEIRAPLEEFMHEYGFTPSLEQLGKKSLPPATAPASAPPAAPVSPKLAAAQPPRPRPAK